MGVENRVAGDDNGQAAARAQQEAAERARREAAEREAAAERARQEAAERARLEAERRAQADQLFAGRTFAERIGLDLDFTRGLYENRFAAADGNGGDGRSQTTAITTDNSSALNVTGNQQTGAVTADNEPPTPEELQATEGLRRVQEANDEARRVWDTLPPDVRRVELNTETGVALFDQWREAARASLGPGNAETLDNFFNDNRESLDALGRVITGTPGSGDVSREQALTERLYAPAITALRQQHPNANFELVALRDTTLEEWHQPSTTRSEIVIAMTETGADGRAQTQHFALDTRLLANQNSNHSAFVQALEASGTTEQWRERMRTHDMNALNWFEISPDAGNNERALSYFGTTAAMEAVQQMEPEQQAAFFTAYAQRAPQAFETMLRPVEVTAEQTIVRADANHLTGTERPTTINSTVNIMGAGTDKLRNFLNQNYQTLVAPTFAQYLELCGDTPRELSGAALTNEIGMAMNLPPNHAPQTAEDEARLNDGTWEFYTGESREAIRPIEEAIRNAAGGDPARVTVLPVMFDSEELSLQQVPLFRVQAPDGSDRFVDTTGRTYDSFSDWRDNNRLPAGRISYPANGHLTAGSDGRAQTVTENSHAVKDTFWEHIAPVVDVVATVGGIIAGGVIIFGSGGTAAPLVLGAASLWAGGRAAEGLHDRATHGQTLSPFDSEARNQWINLGASVLGVGALGAGMRVAGAVSRGANVSSGFLRMTRALTVGAQYADTAATIDGGVNLALNWDRMSPQDRMLAIGQIGFWGVSTGVQARQAGSLRNLYAGREVGDFMRQTGEEVRNAPPDGQSVETITLSDGTTMETLRQVRATSDGVETQWGTVPGRIVGEYDAMRPGPLGDTQNSPAATFSGGRYVAIELDRPVTLYRAYAPETSRELGGFWSQTKPQGMLQAQIDSALRPEWGQMQDAPWRVQATRWVEVEVPAGTRIYVGEVANQSFIDPNTGQGGVWVGGTSQVMIEGGPQAAWVRGGGSLTGETPTYNPARRTDAELQTDLDTTLRTGETQQQADYRTRAAQAEIELRAVMQTYNGLGEVPPRINIAANDAAHHSDGAHTLERHGPNVPVSITDAPAGQRTIEGRVYGDAPWPRAENYSYRWIDEATMNRTVNDYIRSNWNQIRSELVLSQNGQYDVTFDAGHLVGEGYYNGNQTVPGAPRQAVPHRTSFVTMTIELIPGNPPSFFIGRAFPAGRGY